jgi:hypothetical protein
VFLDLDLRLILPAALYQMVLHRWVELAAVTGHLDIAIKRFGLTVT